MTTRQDKWLRSRLTEAERNTGGHLVWRQFHQDELPEPGEYLIADLEEGPYFCEVMQIGAHWSYQPLAQSGYWVLLRQLPDGKELAREYYQELEEELQKEYYEPGQL